MAEEKPPFGKRLGKGVQRVLFLGFNPFDLDGFLDYIGNGKGISRGLVLWILYIGLFSVLSLQVPNLPLFTIEWVVGTAPLWLPPILYYSAVKSWIWYAQSFYIAGQETVLLEVKMPRDVFKSPRAMELAFVPFNLSSGETTFINRGWQGGVRPFWSFEIASFGGDVHFYIWTWKSFRNTVESTMYAYYPEVELHEVEDYSMKFKFDPELHDTYCTDWRLETFMPGVSNGDYRINAYPFRTYVDFELDKDPKEEFKIDPLAQTIEMLSGIRPEDTIWVQIVIRQCGKQGVFKTSNDEAKWRDTVRKEVEVVRKESLIAFTEEEAQKFGRTPRATPPWRQAEQVETMERNLGKYPFEVGLRGWIVSTKPVTSNYYNLMRWMWRPVGNPQYMTHLRPRRWHPPFDWPWQDFHNIRWNTAVRRFIDAYRRRMFYHSPWIIPTNVLTNEELATIWHPVSRAITAPGLERIPAKKVSPPSNLPM